MRKKDISIEISSKLKTLRETHGFSHVEMAKKLKVRRENYVRNETGETTPSIFTLVTLANVFNISIDWLILDRGTMFFTGKEEKEVTTPVKDTAGDNSWPGEIQELLQYMDKIPLLCHEILSHFYRFKEDHRELIERSLQQ